MDIVLTTINARFKHASFGLRCLYANLGALQSRTEVKEFSLGARERDVVEQVLALDPKIVGVSVYIWNVDICTRIVALLRQLRPQLKIIIGGPEVSHEWESMPIFQSADYLIKGEGDLAFAQLCQEIFHHEEPKDKVIHGGLPPLPQLASPYPHYSDFDLEHQRIIYVEASRGCPFRCHFCLSSLDRSVRPFPLPEFLEEMGTLLERGVKQFKFVDRTFNLKAETSAAIMQFFLERYQPGMFLHFEMIPDRLPESLKPIIAAFEPGSLQFEVGIQSFNPEVCDRIGRRQKFELIDENLTYLKEHTGVHVHADLIAGLPGEDLASFGQGFDKLVALGPAEIQVGILKRLRGTPITNAGTEWGMTYSAEAPYEVVRTAHLSFAELQRLQRFARYWDLVANSGRHPDLVSRLLGSEPFTRFMAFSDWLYSELGATHGIAANRLKQLLQRYLVELNGSVPQETSRNESAIGSKQLLPKRQRRHLNTTGKGKIAGLEIGSDKPNAYENHS